MNNRFGLSVFALFFISLVGYDIYTMNFKPIPLINIYIEAPTGVEDSTELIQKAEAMLGTREFQVSLSVGKKRMIEVVRDKTPLQVGVSTIGQVFRVYSDGHKILPVMSVSAHPQLECIAESEIVVPKDSPIKDLSMLQGKKVAMGKRTVRTLHYAFPELREAGITFSQVFSYQEPAEILEKFNTKAIDAAILYHGYFKGEDKVFTDLGTLIKGEYEDPAIKMRTLKVTNYQQPCRVLFVTADLDSELREKFLHHLQNLLSKEELFAPFKNLTQISSYRLLTPEEVLKMNDFSNHPAEMAIKNPKE